MRIRITRYSCGFGVHNREIVTVTDLVAQKIVGQEDGIFVGDKDGPPVVVINPLDVYSGRVELSVED
jgi:hypothetical protein